MTNVSVVSFLDNIKRLLHFLRNVIVRLFKDSLLNLPLLFIFLFQLNQMEALMPRRPCSVE